jgi:hypothetical protein
LDEEQKNLNKLEYNKEQNPDKIDDKQNKVNFYLF